MVTIEKSNVRSMEYRAVGALVPHPNNPRTHSPRQLKQIEVSIRRFGFLNPVLVDGDSRIIAGHGRVAAAKAIGMELVPVVSIEGMSEADRRAYVIADNRLAELAGWDNELLPASGRRRHASSVIALPRAATSSRSPTHHRYSGSR